MYKVSCQKPPRFLHFHCFPSLLINVFIVVSTLCGNMGQTTNGSLWKFNTNYTAAAAPAKPEIPFFPQTIQNNHT